MGQIILATWKTLFRNKSNTFWILCFPIVLGTLFYVAFGNLSASENMNTIPVAVVLEDNTYGDTLKESVESLSTGDDPMLFPTYCEEEKALKLLEEKEIMGIIYSGEEAKLTVSANMSNEPINQSILASFVSEYNMYQKTFIQIATEHPERLEAAIKALDTKVTYNKEVSLTKNQKQDPYSQYFYNLLAMSCLFTAVGGLAVATENQANLSSLAARRTISSTRKLTIISGELLAATSYEFLLNAIGFSYVAFVLKVDILSHLPLAIASMFVGVLTGVCLGFFLGSFGKGTSEFKQGIMFASVMPMCFLSGLMMGNIRIYIEDFCPLINRINPAAIITDCFYSLAMFDNQGRFYRNLSTLVIYSILFCLVGVTKTRRQKYASL